jgi:hypothetical protein
MSDKKKGRPLKGTEELTEQVTFRLSKRQAQCLLDYCWRYDVSPSEAVRFALDTLSITGF